MEEEETLSGQSEHLPVCIEFQEYIQVMKDRKQGCKDVSIHHHICHPCVKQAGSLLHIFLIIRPICHSCSQRLSVGVTMQRGLAPEAVYCCFFHNTLCRQVTVFWQGPDKNTCSWKLLLEQNTYCLGLRLTLHSNLALQRDTYQQ